MHPQALTLDAPAAPVQRAAAGAFARVEVRRQADATVREAWSTLERAAPCSIYQTRAWLLPWVETLGADAGIAPAFVLAWGGDGSVVALLCLGLRRRGPLRVASFLGGKDSNFSLGLFRPGTRWSAGDLRRLLQSAAREIGADAFVFANQPFDWNGAANPLAALPHQLSPSAAYGTALIPDVDGFLAGKLSKDARKKLRKNVARLAETGALAYGVAATPSTRARVLDAFFRQRLERFRAQGIASSFENPMMRVFLERAATPGADGFGLELHYLAAGERIVAVYGGAAHAGRWSGMFNAFDTDPDIAKTSPGELLLMKVIAAQCLAGHTHFDLGVGEARYKARFCGTALPLFDSFIPATPLGWLFTEAAAGVLRLKRRIKQNPRLFRWAKRVRRVHNAGPCPPL